MSGQKTGRRLRLFSAAPFLGRDQEVTLDLAFGARTAVEVTYSEGEGRDEIRVNATVVGTETRYEAVTECLTQLAGRYCERMEEVPHDLLLTTWEKALNEVWKRALIQ